MPARKPSLQQWFLAHQLRRIWSRHCHLPFDLDVDVSRVEAAYAATGRPTPYTAVLIKALALAAARVPAINRMYLPTVFGPKLLEFDHVSVNLPVVLDRGGGRQLGSTVIRDADRLTIREIRAAIREARRLRPEDLPVGRYVHGRSNTAWNRLRLRAIHFAVFNFPGLVLAHKAGGLSVSSLVGELREDLPVRAQAFGPTAFTVVFSHVDRSSPGKTVLRLGVGADHAALRGDEIASGMQALHDVLSARDDKDLDALSR